jgi:hypothetical protein
MDMAIRRNTEGSERNIRTKPGQHVTHYLLDERAMHDLLDRGALLLVVEPCFREARKLPLLQFDLGRCTGNLAPRTEAL